MSDKATADSAAPATTPKKQPTQNKKPRVKPTHPPASEMVLTAIKSLQEHGGSSLQAIKKYIAATYKVDVEKQSTFIKKYLKTAVQQEILTQTKGKGASGSFKLKVSKPKASATKPKTAKPAATAAKKPSNKKPKAATSPKKAVAKKAAAAKKSVTKKTFAKKPATPKQRAVKKSVTKKTAKSPAAKPKAPKPKKAVTKKAAPKKK